jgi:hypothetical protein
MTTTAEWVSASAEAAGMSPRSEFRVVQVTALRRLKAVTADRISALGLPWSG